ncbi:MAG: hypothetical protein A2306_09105 [Omnitrophica WOR_2 bacterium RIFOXYB2_FULL_38_16]|nr:MAG: hypothetical protein A2447_07855 [Omnitrophica WOR_2 bacterium RIFOXYC2_FULL_38_12]OGX60401.1 MAG: hypothetical protein A2306_09105 [Omnitrophica WOR_2 bacterium RIFOXYB2_FULL_38_16]
MRQAKGIVSNKAIPEQGHSYSKSLKSKQLSFIHNVCGDFRMITLVEAFEIFSNLKSPYIVEQSNLRFDCSLHIC